ncbi:GlxA family transcriptional regulator [Pedobacter caeni]|uniref:Transcriptional regulator, AraC family with amidase-like domain n=1 Tax=Pedobacter caeni TaxID=288992 RepID=A0A1M4UR16_9SPHI|nr:DJ-1/PfpI family protein [Pedobacter caeni]SHE59040.1 transcriptional regulator, AraC family with amidase-like domain [Pedobacter caeni]
MTSQRIIFFLFDGVHLLDLAGAVTVFYESGCLGKPYELCYVSPYAQPVSSSGLGFTNVRTLGEINVNASDMVIVAGMKLSRWNRADDALWIPWLQHAAATGATICSVCTAAFALAAAGLLEGQNCTTHWAWTTRLQEQFPGIKVIENRLYVKSGNIYTSAGISTGIDLALFLVEEQHGVAFACTVAKDMVVYIRREGKDQQDSIYIQNRQHINQQVHQVQDYIAHHLRQKISIPELAALVHISPRSLTRLFKSSTSLTIGEYVQKLRMEKAMYLLNDNHKMDWIARECGYKSTSQLRQMMKDKA